MREHAAAIVLAGGGSRRMGTAKAALEWHGSTLVRRAVGLVARAVDGPVVAVRAPGQRLPALPPTVEIADDAREGRGPVQGIAAGLQQIGDRAAVVFVTGIDTPLLHPALVAHVIRSLGAGDDVALPRSGGFDQPLAAAYRAAPLAQLVAEQLARGQLATRSLTARLRVHRLDEAALLADPELAALDPRLDSLLNLNDPAEYESARAKPAPRVTVRTTPGARPQIAYAATLAAAAAAAGIELHRCAGARLDGHGPVDDPDEPLANGDALTFDPAAKRP